MFPCDPSAGGRWARHLASMCVAGSVWSHVFKPCNGMLEVVFNVRVKDPSETKGPPSVSAVTLTSSKL